MKNKELSDLLDRMADLLEFKGENPFKVRAYRRASLVLTDLAEDIELLHRQGGLAALERLPGIGEGIAKKLAGYLTEGKIPEYETLRGEISDDLIALMGIPGMGPKTLALVHREAGVHGLADLKEACARGKLLGLPGMGAKKVENLVKGIEIFEQSSSRMLLGQALPAAEEILAAVRALPGVEGADLAGSLRRRRETIGDLDLLARGKDGPAIVKAFTALPQVRVVLASGETKGSVRIEGGFQMDLRVVPPESYGAALQYFTGSKAHNVHLRSIAKERGFKISEYGIFKGEERVGGEREEDIYRALGLPFVPPELREDRGEIEAAQKGALPKLLSQEEIRGDLHLHTRYSDGAGTVAEMAERARALGYAYLAIADHSPSLKVAHGVTRERLEAQWREIDQWNRAHPKFRVLKGAEVDILPDGALDEPEDVLQALDVVVASVHTGFKMDAEKMTARILAAVRNPNLHILGHPTGRLLSGREPYAFDLEKVMAEAVKAGVALEINANPDRLDLSDVNARRFAEMGGKVAIDTDAHHPDQLSEMALGVAVARRAWLTRGQVVNALPLPDLERWLKKG